MSGQLLDKHDDCFVQLLANCQRGLFLYICGLLFSRELAEDVLQETNLVLWKKRAEYKSNTNFYAWACQVAFYEVRKARDAQRRKVPAFSDLFFEQMSLSLRTAIERPNQLHDYLEECVDILVDQDRQLLKRRYEHDATTKSIADEFGQSVRSINRSLARIHETLFDCIRAKASTESGGRNGGV